MDWYCHISLISSNIRNSCYPWGEEILPSPISEKKMPNTICRTCGTEIWNSYNIVQNICRIFKLFLQRITIRKNVQIQN